MLATLAGDESAALALVADGWVDAHYAHVPCPAAVLRWLFALAAYHPRAAVAAGAARSLSVLLAPAGAAAPEWVPSPAHLFAVLLLQMRQPLPHATRHCHSLLVPAPSSNRLKSDVTRVECYAQD